ncbi:MAG: AI-2E family transporter [bacterium]|nr:AI-2E family transporter [bacterium]
MHGLHESNWHRAVASTLVLLTWVVVTCWMLSPFADGIVWALVLGGITWPAYRALRSRLGDRHALAATLMTLLVLLSVALPVTWLVSRALAEAVPALNAMASMLHAPLNVPAWSERWPWIRPLLERGTAELAQLAPSELFRTLWPRVAAPGTVALKSLGGGLLQAVVTVFTLFFVYRYGDSYRDQTAAVLRFWLGDRADRLWNPIKHAMRAVFAGVILAATAQGLAAALGYVIAGLKAPALLGGITAIAAILPFGAVLVWGGAALSLYLAGATWKALFLVVWGLAIVSTVDNVVRPLVISGTARLPYLQVFFAFLGAATLFGSIGLFIGPAMLAVWLVLWEEWAQGGRNTV